MEQAVAKRHFSQEQHASQPQSWLNGTVDRRGTHLLQDPSQSRDSRGWNGGDKNNMSSSSFNGGNIRENMGGASVCRDNLRGKCTRGSFCKFWHSDFVDHDGARFARNDQRNLGPAVVPRNSQLFSENKNDDSSRRSLIGDCRSKSPCRKFQSGRCFRGSSCPYLHPECTEFRRRSPCRNFQSGRCFRGSTCPHLHPEFAESDRPMHDWNTEHHHGVVMSSRSSRIHEGNVDNNFKTSQVHDAANRENNSRVSLSREPRSRSPCRNFLQGRCHFGASCRRWHPDNSYKHNWSAGNSNNHCFAGAHNALSSQKHDEAHQHNNLRTGPPCLYFQRGSCYQGAPSNLHPLTVYDRARYDLGAQHHQGVTATSRDLRFDRGNVVREVNRHGVGPYQDPHAGFNVNTNHKAWSTKEQLASNKETMNVAQRSWSSERKRIRPDSDFVGDQQKPEVCLKFTKGRCDQGENCKYLHSFHEYASSISQPSKKSHLENTADLMSIDQANHGGETMVVHKSDTFRRDKMESNENVNLWSPPFQRQRTWNTSSFNPEDNAHHRTLRHDYSQGNFHRNRPHHESLNQRPDCRVFKCDGPANRMNNDQHLKDGATSANPSLREDTEFMVMASDGHGETVIYSKKNEVESVPNALRCNHADQKAKDLVTAEISEGATGINQDPPDNTAMVVLEKRETAGMKVDLNHEKNENSEETEHMAKTYTRMKRNNQHPSSDRCGPEYMMEEVTDTSSQSLPISSSTGGTLLEHKTSVPKTDIGDVLANDYQVEDPGNEFATIKVQSTMLDHSSADIGDDRLLGITDNSALLASQPSDASILSSKRKLLVMDVNGLLADIVADFPDRYKPETTVGGKAVFKRPFCDDFLQFCFEKFDVGIWSSRTEKNVTRVLDCLMNNTKNKLLFCWHQSHCTLTGYNTIENNDKPLVLKELKKLWEKQEKDLPWKKGFYNETNTILLDDSPYKALRNPPYTAIFPFPYSFRQVGDKSLGPDGELRLYLERLAEADNVQEFIKENPFGQRPITKTNLSWGFYSKIAGEYASQHEATVISKRGFLFAPSR